MADVGFGSVAANEMSLRVSRGDWQGAERVFQSAWASVLMLTTLGGAWVLAAVWLPWAQWLRLEALPAWELRGALGVVRAGSASSPEEAPCPSRVRPA